MKILSAIKIKAVVTGLIAFCVFYIVTDYIVGALPGSGISPVSFAVTSGYISFIVSGYLAGFVSKQAGVLNAAIVGVLTPLVNTMYMVWSKYGLVNIIANLSEHGLFWVTAGGIFCGFGGLLWDIRCKIIKSTSNKAV